MSETKRRHKWGKGVEVRCLNPGCCWERRWRPDAGGYHVGPLEYRNGSAMVRWETETRVPPCEGRS